VKINSLNGLVLMQVSAQTRDDPFNRTPHLPVLMVSNQEDLRAGILENCTHLINSIGLLSNYTGPFELNGITNFAGAIFPIDLHTIGDEFSVPGLTTLVMEDLVYMDEMIYLIDVAALETVSIPKATYVDEIVIRNLSTMTFDFSSLMNAGTIQISSGSTASHFEVSFPTLTNASRINISGNLGKSM
jgi:hypothetical protein